MVMVAVAVTVAAVTVVTVVVVMVVAVVVAAAVGVVVTVAAVTVVVVAAAAAVAAAAVVMAAMVVGLVGRAVVETHPDSKEDPDAGLVDPRGQLLDLSVKAPRHDSVRQVDEPERQVDRGRGIFVG